MGFVGIIGARRFEDRQAVEAIVESLVEGSIVVTSGCKGVCTWAKIKAQQLGMQVMVFAPDLSNIQYRFEIPERYYKRNRELIEKCDFVHAFISRQGGYSGGTRFEIEYAIKRKTPIQIHWEDKADEFLYRHHLILQRQKHFSLTAWRDFFRTVVY